MRQLRFDGRVAIVTGAGGGLGRAHALMLASRGAKVVVNDLGGGVTGEGTSSSAADAVVAEIVQAGGAAIANYDSVENGERIVAAAIDAWGKIDVLVNNAGILRDVSFAKMTYADWDLVYRVHLLGAFRCSHAAWPHMREAGFGRIINTSSASGIYGNFGQANYAAAKLALHGLTQTLAAEGRKRNIVVNSIAPIAGSRMTETIFSKSLVDAMRPEYVSALVGKLAHESTEDSGGLYEVGGGFFAKLRWERAAGKTFQLGREITPELVDSTWPAITSFDRTTHPSSLAESLQPIVANIDAEPSRGGNPPPLVGSAGPLGRPGRGASPGNTGAIDLTPHSLPGSAAHPGRAGAIDPDAALGYSYPERITSYDERDVALYALGVGAGSDPTNEVDLAQVYELVGTGMSVLPSFGVLPAINLLFAHAKSGMSVPGLAFGLDRVLHGEQYTEVMRPLPVRATLRTKATVTAIHDKGKAAVIQTEFTTYDESGNALIKNIVATFVRGAGGWGGARGPSIELNVPPERAPDKTSEQRTSPNQALLYRLSGDWNPLHADPKVARSLGFDRPILHGLCAMGFATRAVAAAFSPQGDPRFVRSIKVRFASPVFPGETLITEMWQHDERIVFRCKVKERNEICVSNAAIELWKQLP